MRSNSILRAGRRWLALLALGAVATVARATTVIYPVEAIDDLWNLPSDEFKTKFAGINITGLGPSDEGWYVRYRHENLTYMFGPLAGYGRTVVGGAGAEERALATLETEFEGRGGKMGQR